jgi:cytochrome c553
MSHFKCNIAAIFALAALLTSIAAFAQDEDINPLRGRTIGLPEDSADAIKQRSGPGDPVAGRTKSQLCQGCHGEVGISTEPLIPKLAGQYGPYISKQVLNYQAGVRSHQIMNAMAATLTDADLADVAAYFASQKKMKGSGSSENQLGKNIFLHSDTDNKRYACVNCHGPHGKGIDPKITTFPVIGGQHKDYLRRQLINFREGDRTNSPNGIMNQVASSLSDDEIESLVEYISEQ